ncbi:signal peptidase I SipW [Heyndrickxia acidicola]|uniref:Signal peptidase I n=1 Tax=Heyndrickxia acidicola TaxID=209389 RepID=A0ABU6MMZ4_9BACI|nr:signal peptidase I [Heyndrickxia acidicola]MED1205762.1 signal peptidase I [Heyndrickxia acidicola]
MQKKIIRIASSLLKGISLIVLCLLVFSILSARVSGGEPTILGYQVKTVLSGSMEPTFQTGSIISIKLGNQQNSYQKGDIITFNMDGKTITHRIFEVKKVNENVSYKTKGDNNNAPDVWTVAPSDVVGKYTGFTIPYIGYVMNYANSKAGAALLLIVPGIFLILSAMYSIVGARKELEAEKVL